MDYLRDNRGNIIRLITRFALSLRLSDYRQHGRASRHDRTAYNERTDKGQGVGQGKARSGLVGALNQFYALRYVELRTRVYPVVRAVGNYARIQASTNRS